MTLNNERSFYSEQDIIVPASGRARNTWDPDFRDGPTFAPSHIEPTDAHYIRVGELVYICASIPFTYVTNFGTAQYKIQLPFPAGYHADFFGGTIHDTSAGTFHTVKGHIEKNSAIMTLWHLAASSTDQPFTHNSPINLAPDDEFHIAGWYEVETL